MNYMKSKIKRLAERYLGYPIHRDIEKVFPGELRINIYTEHGNFSEDIQEISWEKGFHRAYVEQGDYWGVKTLDGRMMAFKKDEILRFDYKKTKDRVVKYREI